MTLADDITVAACAASWGEPAVFGFRRRSSPRGSLA
jgi:hypothetical protein